MFYFTLSYTTLNEWIMQLHNYNNYDTQIEKNQQPKNQFFWLFWKLDFWDSPFSFGGDDMQDMILTAPTCLEFHSTWTAHY